MKKGSRKGSYARLDIDEMEDDDGFGDGEFRKGSIYPDQKSESGISIPVGSVPSS